MALFGTREDPLVTQLKEEVKYLRERLAELDKTVVALTDPKAFAMRYQPPARPKAEKPEKAAVLFQVERRPAWVPQKTREQVEKEFEEEPA